MSLPPVHYRDLPAEKDGDMLIRTLISDLAGSGLEQRILRVEGTASCDVPEARDEVLYVVAGRGELEVDGATHAVSAGVALRINGRNSYVVRNSGRPLEIVAVSGFAPITSAETNCSARLNSLDQETRAAVSNREYRVLFDLDSGCSGMTQFLGYVPAVRTRMHIHPYSETIYIVAGRGTVEIGDQVTDVSPGWSYYLPEGVPHRVENKDPENYLIELGVFTPSGSPAQNTPVD